MKKREFILTEVFAAVAVVDAKAPYYGAYPGTYDGGKGAFKKEIFRQNKGTVLNIVVGQRGGNSVEVKGCLLYTSPSPRD